MNTDFRATGLLGYAIGHMDGMRGYHGWRWIFILGTHYDNNSTLIGFITLTLHLGRGDSHMRRWNCSVFPHL